MAAGYYQFTFGGSAGSDIAVAYSTAANGPWTAYAEPAWPPNNANRGSVLVVNPNDTVYLQLVGPANWAMSTGGQLQVVIARANRAASGQAYSPFGGSVVWMNPPGQMNGNVWQAALGTINLNPGPGKFNYFEITIAFSANLPNVTGPVYFAEDPEMDVDGM